MQTETAGIAAEVERTSRLLERGDLDRLIQSLRRSGHRVVGPLARDGAIVLDTIEHVTDLPEGWIDEQSAGAYTLRREGRWLFGHTVPLTSAKRFLHPPHATLWRAKGGAHGFDVAVGPATGPPLALLGLKPCDLAALAVHDRVLLGGPWADPVYRDRRAGVWVIVVQCGRAGANCFCTSMGGGPRAATGFDIALTELADGDTTVFVAEPGSARGAELLAATGARPASDADDERAVRAGADAAAQVTRRLDTSCLAAALAARPEHPRWQETAARCLACGNCTQVCPTCFCVAVDDRPALDGATADRVRRWDSCFAPDYSYIHGGHVRASVRARYRHWLTHKLSTWHEQFGSSGCVGCGRCIAWCPAGIDLTVEAAAVAAGAGEDTRP